MKTKEEIRKEKNATLAKEGVQLFRYKNGNLTFGVGYFPLSNPSEWPYIAYIETPDGYEEVVYEGV